MAAGIPTQTIGGRYVLHEPLGMGGMGAVYLAKDTKLGRAVALTVLPPELMGDPEREARFQRSPGCPAELRPGEGDVRLALGRIVLRQGEQRAQPGTGAGGRAGRRGAGPGPQDLPCSCLYIG